MAAQTDPSPSSFYSAFRRVVGANSELLLQKWTDSHSYTDVIRDVILPAMAAELNMGFHLECQTLDAAFFQATGETWARYLSVAIEHENDYSTAVEEMYKLQRFNAPLTVLITYPGRPEIGERILKKYAAIIKAADVFGNATTTAGQS